MPNHIHTLVQPINGYSLSRILQTWKWRIAREANRILEKTNERFWQPESFDRIVRNTEERNAICRYIRENPVKAGFCRVAEEWPWSSASPRWQKTTR